MAALRRLQRSREGLDRRWDSLAADHEHRPVRLVQDAPRDAAQQRACQGAVSAPADDDHVGVNGVRVRNDLIDRVAAEHGGLGLDCPFLASAAASSSGVLS